MTDDDITALRELAESVVRSAEARQKAADDPAIDWIEYDDIAQVAVDQQEALVERVGARALLSLLSRLEAAERERDDARDSLTLVAAERDALLADWNAVQVAAGAKRPSSVLLRVRDLRAERDGLLALLRDARDAITLAGYGSRMAPEVRDTLDRIDAIAAKEQK